MMNPQEFYIQHLGIGSIWKLRQSVDTPTQQSMHNADVKNAENATKRVNDTYDTYDAENKPTFSVERVSSALTNSTDMDVEFDILILRSPASSTSSASNEDTEQLFENIVKAFQQSQNQKPFDVSVKKIDTFSEPTLFEQLSQVSDVRVVVFFDEEILQKFRDKYQQLLQETSRQQVYLLNHLLLIQFPTLIEMIEKPLLKRDAWERICLLQKHLTRSA